MIKKVNIDFNDSVSKSAIQKNNIIRIGLQTDRAQYLLRIVLRLKEPIPRRILLMNFVKIPEEFSLQIPVGPT